MNYLNYVNSLDRCWLDFLSENFIARKMSLTIEIIFELSVLFF